MGAAKDGAVYLDAMPNYAAVAMVAVRGQGMDRTLETVERVRFSVQRNLPRPPCLARQLHDSA
jgi:hypothetical protein